MKRSCVSWCPLGSLRLVACFGCALGFARLAIADERENGQSLRGIGSLIFRAEQKLLGNDTSSSDYFGQSVAISGETIVVGAPYDSNDCPAARCGAAYVFQLDHNGTPNNPADDRWVQLVKLRGMDTRPEDTFGTSVSISENYIAVGAPNARGPQNTQDGAIYVFEWDGEQWREQSKITRPNSNGRLGTKVAASNDVLVATLGNSPVLAFIRNGGAWTNEVELHLFSTISAIAVDQDLVAVSGNGAVNLYRRASGVWRREARITSPKPFLPSDFGNAIALNDDILVVGASLEVIDICPPMLNCQYGAAYVFQQHELAWEFTAQLSAEDRFYNDNFGAGVASGDGFVFVGAPFYDFDDCPEGQSCDNGAVYSFMPVDGIWREQARFTESTGTAQQYLGNSVAADGFRVVAGAYQDNERGLYAGAAFTYIAFQDCNSNEIPDQNESDCNENSVPDDCDIRDGLAVDCNGNIVPDDCDLANKTSVDCDGNDVPDECDTLYTIPQSAQLGPIGAGMSRSFTIPNAPRSGGPVTLSFTARGDFGSPSEAIMVDINGSSIGTILDGPEGHDCPTVPDMDQIVVGNGEFNSALNESDAVIRLVPTSAVDPNPTACSSFVTVRVAYQAIVPGDCNGNGIPDVCDVQTISEDCNDNGIPDECEFDWLGDFDGNRSVALSDSAVFFECLDGPCVDSICNPEIAGGSCCIYADFDLDGDVDLKDVATLQKVFGTSAR